jgi:folate-binding protein YgfZ
LVIQVLKMLSLEARMETDYGIALEHAGWAELQVGVIRVAGSDRVQWLHRIVTADVEHLGFGRGTHAALLDAKGHFVADFIALVEQESILLLTEPAPTGHLLDGLRRYIIREKVKLTDGTGEWGLFTLVGKESDRVTARLFSQAAPEPPYSFANAQLVASNVQLIRSQRARLPVTDILFPSDARDHVRKALDTIPEFGNEVLEIMRIEAGLPRWGIDFDSSTLVLEITDVLSVRVDQGCYVGQEVVARLVHRGHVNRKLVGLRFEGDAPPSRGELILDGDKEVGSVTSAAISPRFGTIGLGFVRREVSEIGAVLHLGNHLRVHVVKLPFEG